MEGNLPFLLCFTLYLSTISEYKPPGGVYILRGDSTEGVLCYEFLGLIFGGAYTWRGLFSEFYGILGENAIALADSIPNVFLTHR